MPLRTPYGGGFAVLCKHRMAVIHAAQRVLAHSRLGAALAHGPGRAMAGQRFLAEPPDIVVTHILEEIPGLVMGAGMGGAIPEIFRQILGRFGDAAVAGSDAARRLTEPGLRFWHALFFRLDPDVAFEPRGAGCGHALDYGVQSVKDKKTYCLTFAPGGRSSPL